MRYYLLTELLWCQRTCHLVTLLGQTWWLIIRVTGSKFTRLETLVVKIAWILHLTDWHFCFSVPAWIFSMRPNRSETYYTDWLQIYLRTVSGGMDGVWGENTSYHMSLQSHTLAITLSTSSAWNLLISVVNAFQSSIICVHWLTQHAFVEAVTTFSHALPCSHVTRFGSWGRCFVLH